MSALSQLEQEVDHGQVVLGRALLVSGRVERLRIDQAIRESILNLQYERRRRGIQYNHILAEPQQNEEGTFGKLSYVTYESAYYLIDRQTA